MWQQRLKDLAASSDALATRLRIVDKQKKKKRARSDDSDDSDEDVSPPPQTERALTQADLESFFLWMANEHGILTVDTSHSCLNERCDAIPDRIPAWYPPTKPWCIIRFCRVSGRYHHCSAYGGSDACPYLLREGDLGGDRSKPRPYIATGWSCDELVFHERWFCLYTHQPVRQDFVSQDFREDPLTLTAPPTDDDDHGMHRHDSSLPFEAVEDIYDEGGTANADEEDDAGVTTTKEELVPELERALRRVTHAALYMGRGGGEQKKQAQLQEQRARLTARRNAVLSTRVRAQVRILGDAAYRRHVLCAPMHDDVERRALAQVALQEQARTWPVEAFRSLRFEDNVSGRIVHPAPSEVLMRHLHEQMEIDPTLLDTTFDAAVPYYYMPEDPFAATRGRPCHMADYYFADKNAALNAVFARHIPRIVATPDVPLLPLPPPRPRPPRRAPTQTELDVPAVLTFSLTTTLSPSWSMLDWTLFKHTYEMVQGAPEMTRRAHAIYLALVWTLALNTHKFLAQAIKECDGALARLAKTRGWAVCAGLAAMSGRSYYGMLPPLKPQVAPGAISDNQADVLLREIFEFAVLRMSEPVLHAFWCRRNVAIISVAEVGDRFAP